MSDPRIAALAEALIAVDVKSIDDWWTWEPAKLAAAILAAMPPGWCGHDEGEWQAERDALKRLVESSGEQIARLRKIEEAARDVAAGAEAINARDSAAQADRRSTGGPWHETSLITVRAGGRCRPPRRAGGRAMTRRFLARLPRRLPLPDVGRC